MWPTALNEFDIPGIEIMINSDVQVLLKVLPTEKRGKTSDVTLAADAIWKKRFSVV